MTHVSIGLTKVIPGSFWGEQIDKATGGGGFCHAFIYFHRLNMVWEAHADFGVRFKDRKVEDNEILVQLPDVDEDGMWNMLRIACGLAGDDYDFKGVIAFKIGIIHESPGDEFCSEGVVMVGQRGVGMFSAVNAPQISPNDLAGLLAWAGLLKL